MDQALLELIELSRTLGSDIRLVWAGGGNISVKTGGDMFIKASGTELGKMNRKRGWRKVNLIKVRRLLDNLLNHKVHAAGIKKGLLDTCCDEVIDASMPSIETFFHALLGRCVIHLHPMAVLGYLCSKNGYKRLKEILTPQFDFHWIEFRGLGVVTAGQILRQIHKKKLNLSNINIFFLSNHGLIVSGECAGHVKKIVRQIVNRCQKHLPPNSPIPAAGKHEMIETAARIQSACRLDYDCIDKQKILSIVPLRTPNGLIPQKEWFRGVLTPEELTYLGGGIAWLKKTDLRCIRKTIEIHRRKTGLWPKAFFVAGRGLFVLEQKKYLKLYKKIFAGYLQIRGRAVQLGGFKPLARQYLSGEGL